MAVGAFDARPINGLWAPAAVVTHLVAVAALNPRHVAGLRALLRDMALAVAVAALNDTLIGALLCAMTLLVAVTANLGLLVRAVRGEVAH